MRKRRLSDASLRREQRQNAKASAEGAKQGAQEDAEQEAHQDVQVVDVQCNECNKAWQEPAAGWQDQDICTTCSACAENMFGDDLDPGVNSAKLSIVESYVRHLYDCELEDERMRAAVLEVKGHLKKTALSNTQTKMHQNH